MAEETKPVTSPDGESQEARIRDAVAEVEAGILGQASVPAEGLGTEVPKQGDDLLTGDVTVDWGEGTRRTVPIGKLVEAARKAEDLERQQEALKLERQENRVYAQIGDLIASMNDSRRAQLKRIFENPGLLDTMGNGRHQQPRDADDALPDDGVEPSPGSQAAERLARMEQQIEHLRRHAEAELAQKQSQTLAQRVQETMASFDVFGKANVKGYAGRIKQSILNALAVDPSATIERTVAVHAADLERLLAGERQGVVNERMGGSPSQTVPKGWKPSGEDMMSGKLLKHVLDITRS